MQRHNQLRVWDPGASSRFDPYPRLVDDTKRRRARRQRWFTWPHEEWLERDPTIDDDAKAVLGARRDIFLRRNFRRDAPPPFDWSRRRSIAYRKWRDSRLPGILDRITVYALQIERQERKRLRAAAGALHMEVQGGLMQASAIAQERSFHEPAEASLGGEAGGE